MGTNITIIEMKFTITEPDINFMVVRFTSEGNVWEAGVRQVIYGFRASAGRIGSDCVEVDYCCGIDLAFAFTVLQTVVQIMESIPETVTLQEVRRLFPVFEVKPISRDPGCLMQLREIAINSNRNQLGETKENA